MLYKGWTEVETENDWGGGKGRRQWEKPSESGCSKWHSWSDWLTECQPVSKYQVPIYTNFKGAPSVVMWLTWFVFTQKNIHRQYLWQTFVYFFLGFSPLIPHCWPFPQALRCGTSKKQRKSNNWIHLVHFPLFFNKLIGLHFVALKNLKTFDFTNGWSSWSQCKYRDQKIDTVNHNYKVR